MANRGRDLKVGILSDTDQFDVDKPVRELERLGDEALKAAKDLDKSVDDIDDSLGDLARDAKTTADKVDNAFDAIAKSSRSNFRKIDDDADKAARGLDDFKDEAGSSGREAAASFSGGFDDITDLVQETAANAFAGFGPLGAAAGIAAAAGIGFVVTRIQEAKEKFNELRQEFTAGLIEGNGDLRGSVVLDKIQKMAEDGTINDFADQARKAKVPVEDYLLALAGDQNAIDRTRDALSKYDTTVGTLDATQRAALTHAQDMHQELNNVEGAYGLAEQAAARYDEATKELAEKIALEEEANNKHAASVDSVASALRNAGDAQDELAEKIDEGKGKISAKDIVKILDEETKAAQEFTKNMQEVMETGSADFIAWVSEQGPAVAKAYANGTEKEKQNIFDAFKRNVGAQQGLGTAAGLDSSQNQVRDAAGNLYTVTKNQLTGETILIPTTVGSPNNTRAVLRDVQNNMQPVVIPVMLQNVPRSVMSRYIP